MHRESKIKQQQENKTKKLDTSFINLLKKEERKLHDKRK